MKTKVTFTISNQIPFTSEEGYSKLGIEISFVDGKLAAIETVVEHGAGAERAEIVAEARSSITPLLSLIEFGYGLPANIDGVQTHIIEPAFAVSIGTGFVKVAATLARQVSMPPAEVLAGLTDSTRRQLDWYLLGLRSTSVIERIKNLYNVLEHEEWLTAKHIPSYHPPQEATYWRDAVSHPELDNKRLLKYLEDHIGSSHIDPNNERHIGFLEGKAENLQALARDIVETKVPKWW